MSGDVIEAKSGYDRTLANRSKSERTLFFALWAFLLLGYALYRFWPDDTPKALPPLAIEVAPELKPWFSSVKVRTRGINRYLLNIELTPEYRSSLRGKPKTIRMNYRLAGPEQKFQEGVVGMNIQPQHPGTLLSIPNLEKIPASRIELFLTH